MDLPYDFTYNAYRDFVESARNSYDPGKPINRWYAMRYKDTSKTDIELYSRWGNNLVLATFDSQGNTTLSFGPSEAELGQGERLKLEQTTPVWIYTIPSNHALRQANTYFIEHATSKEMYVYQPGIQFNKSGFTHVPNRIDAQIDKNWLKEIRTKYKEIVRHVTAFDKFTNIKEDQSINAEIKKNMPQSSIDCINWLVSSSKTDIDIKFLHQVKFYLHEVTKNWYTTENKYYGNNYDLKKDLYNLLNKNKFLLAKLENKIKYVEVPNVNRAK